jgi:ATP-binding cassette subfamily D (ALD) long-chain fatty acid import protein
MAIFSRLRPSDASLAHFATTYTTHRPLIQRFLTSGFVLYVLGTTYRGLSARPSKPSSGTQDSKKGKGRDGKTPRVAVGSTILHVSLVSLRSS